jgi:hypothetical protein
MNEPPGLIASCLGHGLLVHCGGEPSIGVDLATNTAMMQMMLTTARIQWDDSQIPPAATWTNVSFTGFGRTSDPVSSTDTATGRTLQVQLCPDSPCNSTVGIVTTDDDGATWSEPVRLGAPFPDKPVVGSGPYHDPTPAGVSFPSAVYMCAADGFHFASQDINCYRSDDGGHTWGPQRPIGSGQGPCLPFVGEVEVDRAGTAYVPIEHCGDAQGVGISDDNGDTWRVTTVAGVRSASQTLDQYPDVAAGGDGRVYYAASSRGTPVIATSDDHGRHWSQPVDVAAGSGIRYTEFPTIVAGDRGRAAFSFLGTTDPGYPENANFEGAWHLYVSVTLDGGATWHTTDVTGADPVQRGCIGTKLFGSCKRRNLLDFIDSTIDADGRVLVAYTDGCVSDVCVGPNGRPDDSNDSTYAVARQVSGPRM